ncbi:MAG: hypothetical protein EBR82_71755 [Caulobacteraceae bacterium]|nr:hypothetical protein [Caulobacteraceae bacterium]
MYTERYVDGTLIGIECIQGDSTIAYIPILQDNVDYQRYKAWLADGNMPQVMHSSTTIPSDEPTPEERLAALELVVSMVLTEDDADV